MLEAPAIGRGFECVSVRIVCLVGDRLRRHPRADVRGEAIPGEERVRTLAAGTRVGDAGKGS